MIAHNPIHWINALAPIVLGLLFWIFGGAQAPSAGAGNGVVANRQPRLSHRSGQPAGASRTTSLRLGIAGICCCSISTSSSS